jgi:hypothetical protein
MLCKNTLHRLCMGQAAFEVAYLEQLQRSIDRLKQHDFSRCKRERAEEISNYLVEGIRSAGALS